MPGIGYMRVNKTYIKFLKFNKNISDTSAVASLDEIMWIEINTVLLGDLIPPTKDGSPF